MSARSPTAGRLETTICAGNSTDRKPWAIHFTGKIDPMINIRWAAPISGT